MTQLREEENQTVVERQNKGNKVGEEERTDDKPVG